jgi:hypothetical protein
VQLSEILAAPGIDIQSPLPTLGTKDVQQMIEYCFDEQTLKDVNLSDILDAPSSMTISLKSITEKEIVKQLKMKKTNDQDSFLDQSSFRFNDHDDDSCSETPKREEFQVSQKKTVVPRLKDISNINIHKSSRDEETKKVSEAKPMKNKLPEI